MTMTNQPTIIELLRTLRQQGIELWLDDGQLRFRAPKGALTAVLRTQLVNRKPELIDFLQQADNVASANGTVKPITAVSRTESLPLSFAQQRLWFLDRFDPGNVAYNIPAAVRIQGDLDIALLANTFSHLMQRHELLRTTFKQDGSTPEQIIHDNWSFAFNRSNTLIDVVNPIIDLCHLPQAERESAAMQHDAGR